MFITNKNIKDITKARYFGALPNFKNEQTQKLTNIILTLITISLFGMFAINPTLSTIVRLKKELSDNEFVEHSLEEKIRNLSVLQQKHADIQEDIPYVLDSIPERPEVPLLLAQIQAIAKNTNVRIANLQNLAVELFRQNIGEKKYYSYSFSLSGSGNFEDISAFFSKIVNMQRIISIDTFSIDSTADKAGALRFSLRGLAYYKL
ncbi:MAG: type 4a pilus biogenesis protein PilO [Patescibacteria group bacterium]